MTSNTSSTQSEGKSATIINTNYTFTRLTAASVRLCTDVPLWIDPCGTPMRFSR